jgi:hypothetical protein
MKHQTKRLLFGHPVERKVWYLFCLFKVAVFNIHNYIFFTNTFNGGNQFFIDLYMHSRFDGMFVRDPIRRPKNRVNGVAVRYIDGV